MDKMLDGSPEIGRLVFRNTTTRKNAVYVIILTGDPSKNFVRLYVAWGDFYRFIDKDIEALQVRERDISVPLFSSALMTARKIAIDKQYKSYEFQPSRSQWPADHSYCKGAWSASKVKVSPAPAPIKPKAKAAPVESLFGNAKPMPAPAARQTTRKDKDRGTIAGFLEI